MGWDKGDREGKGNSDAETVTHPFPEQTDALIVSKQGQV